MKINEIIWRNPVYAVTWPIIFGSVVGVPLLFFQDPFPIIGFSLFCAFGLIGALSAGVLFFKSEMISRNNQNKKHSEVEK